MKVSVIQSNYLPWKGYFDLINDADTFVYYDEVKYTKNDWRNRNKIYPVNGEQWLTIPISKEAVKLKISEVMIPDSSWQKTHFKSLYYAYKKAPFFSQIEPLINEVYLNRTWKSLSELNRYLIEKFSGMIGIRTKFVDSKDFDLAGDKADRLFSLLIQLKASEYITGPSAKDYLAGSENKFMQNNIKLSYWDYSGYPLYKQMREPFIHAVSIMDMLANLSFAEIPYYIWGWRNKNN